MCAKHGEVLQRWKSQRKSESERISLGADSSQGHRTRHKANHCLETALAFTNTLLVFLEVADLFTGPGTGHYSQTILWEGGVRSSLAISCGWRSPVSLLWRGPKNTHFEVGEEAQLLPDTCLGNIRIQPQKTVHTAIQGTEKWVQPWLHVES